MKCVRAPLLCCVLFFMLLGCGSSSSSERHQQDLGSTFSEMRFKAMAVLLQDPYWQKRWWLEKTVRVMRGGRGLLPSEDADGLMALSEEEILAKLQSDPRFGDMVLDFNLFFLGFKPDRIRHANGEFANSAYDFPPAISSAKEVLKNGDYFKILDMSHPIYSGPVSVFGKSPEELSDKEWILAVGERLEANLTAIIDFASTEPAPQINEVCRRLTDHINSSQGDFFSISTYPAAFVLQFSLDWYSGVKDDCAKNPSSLSHLTEKLKKVRDSNRRYIASILQMTRADYRFDSVADIRAVDLSADVLGTKPYNYGFQQRFGLQNSSTNFNRKRAAYTLKRFFCDDLTPVGVEDPKEHTGGSHGSQTSCFACHYKLDPMAGFFRNYGSLMIDFSGRQQITFDDGAVVDLQTYLQNWKGRAGSGRDWEVGYIRSVNREESNEYGESPDDLHKILRQAPEVKRCVVKRLFQYFNSEDQTMDGGFLTYLTEELERRSRENSTEAFKWVVSQIALGKTFRHPDPRATECYDYGPGGVPGNAPPCRVDFILQKNCVTCHDSVYGSAQLDLSRWINLADGSRNFPHEDNGGAQRPMRETLERIAHRLSVRDPNKRMPLKREMSSQERQELYLWTQELIREGALLQ